MEETIEESIARQIRQDSKEELSSSARAVR